MQPTLFDLSLFGRSFALDAHGLCVTLGAIAGLVLALRLARHRLLSQAELRDLGLELILVGVLGARVLYLLVNLRAYTQTCVAGEDSFSGCLRPLWLWEGGLFFLGGILAGVAWLAWRAPRKGISALVAADVFAPGLALAQGIAAVGCLLAGCCFGRPTSSALGLRFPDASIAYQVMFERGLLLPGAESTPPLHPVQIYDAIAHLGLCVGLYLLGRRSARHRPGLLFASYLAGHALLRLSLEPLLGEGQRVVVIGGLSFDRVMAGAFLVAAALIARHSYARKLAQ